MASIISCLYTFWTLRKGKVMFEKTWVRYKYYAFNYPFFVCLNDSGIARCLVSELCQKYYVESAEIIVGEPQEKELRMKR